jgi:hypothetical protein
MKPLEQGKETNFMLRIADVSIKKWVIDSMQKHQGWAKMVFGYSLASSTTLSPLH